MKNIVELKTKDGKSRTCKINGRSKKLYVDVSNPKVHYIRHNNKYIPKDQYNKKRKMRGGDNGKIHVVVVLDSSDSSDSTEINKKYKVASVTFVKPDDNFKFFGIKTTEDKSLLSSIKNTPFITFDYGKDNVYIYVQKVNDLNIPNTNVSLKTSSGYLPKIPGIGKKPDTVTIERLDFEKNISDDIKTLLKNSFDVTYKLFGIEQCKDESKKPDESKELDVRGESRVDIEKNHHYWEL